MHLHETLADTLRNDRWRRQFEREATLNADDIVPCEARAAVPVSYEVAESLIRHARKHMPWVHADAIGWDVRRVLGDQAGLDLYDCARWILDEDNDEEAPQRLWPAFDRPRLASDVMLIDLADEATHCGWQAPSEIAAALERLRDLAKESSIRRQAAEEAADDEAFAAEEERQFEQWRSDQRAMQAAAQAEWDAFNGFATAEQVHAFTKKFERLIYPLERSAPVSIVPFPASPAVPLADLIQTSGDFVKGFAPPDYLVDGILQRRFCYSVTAQTGIGKTAIAMLLAGHVSTGKPLGGVEVAKGTVLYFAGENPTDVQMRWLGLTQEMGIDPAATDVHFIAGAVPLSSIAERVTAEVQRKGLQLALVIVDTAAAYFEGDDENSNTQAVEHAKRMRSLTTLPGGPCVMVLCHPTKRAADDDLNPRGGGAFLAEVDGNVALRRRETTIAATAQGKFRGSDSWSLCFELKAVQHPALRDSKGKAIWTVVAQALNEAGSRVVEAANRRQEDALLRALDKHPNKSLRDLATVLGWMDSNGNPYASKVSRAAQVLEREKLIRKHRGNWQLTPAGEKELNRLDTESSKYPLIPTVPPGATAPPLPPPIPPS
jgi:hypothetical protein